MNNLRVYNEELFEKSLNIENYKELSSPNLVSSKRFLNVIGDNPILYLGQETNGWVNYDFDRKITIDDIEDAYDDFMIDEDGRNSVFWQFIKEIIDRKPVANNVVWTNTLLMGKRYDKGTPEHNFSLLDISNRNLSYLYNYFNPKNIIIAAGNSNPYYKVITEFLREIDSSLVDKWPTKEEPLLVDEDNSIFWTYHPMYLRKSKQTKEVIEKIKNKK